MDPDTIASLKNVTIEMDSFMTRNPDTGKWYATLESTFSFCGFYDYNDALGVGSSHSDPETCRLYKTPLLVMVFTFVAKLLKSTCTWITIYLLIEIVVLVFICTGYWMVTLAKLSGKLAVMFRSSAASGSSMM